VTSNVAKGQYFKQRSKRWFEAQGYVVAFLERVLHVQGKHGLIPVKRDQLGSDLVAVSEKKILLIQVKGGASCRSQLAAARAEFAKYPLAPYCENWIVMWLPQARAPEVEVVRVGPCRPTIETLAAPLRRRAKPLPLFQASAR
jgi:hypothetical protein